MKALTLIAILVALTLSVSLSTPARKPSVVEAAMQLPPYYDADRWADTLLFQQP